MAKSVAVKKRVIASPKEISKESRATLGFTKRSDIQEAPHDALGVFRFITGNREINEKNLHNIKEAIKKKNLLHLNPIVVNQDFGVIDGQHRLQAARDLGLSVYFIEGEADDRLDLDDIQMLNTASKQWSCKDRLDMFCKRGMIPYLRLRTFIQEYKVHITVAQTLLGGKKRNTTEFNDGKFQIKEPNGWTDATNIMELVNKFSEYFDGYKDRSFILAIADLYYLPGFKPEVMLHKITYQSTRLRKCVSKLDYMKMLQEVYNHSNREPLTFKERETE